MALVVVATGSIISTSTTYWCFYLFYYFSLEGFFWKHPNTTMPCKVLVNRISLFYVVSLTMHVWCRWKGQIRSPIKNRKHSKLPSQRQVTQLRSVRVTEWNNIRKLNVFGFPSTPISHTRIEEFINKKNWLLDYISEGTWKKSSGWVLGTPNKAFYLTLVGLDFEYM